MPTPRSPVHLLVAAALLAACSDGPSAAPPPDACELSTPIALGDTVGGTLDHRSDCLLKEGRLKDDYRLKLPDSTTLFTVTLTTTGYHPLMPLYRDSIQVSGWASATQFTLTREHAFPAGDYVLRSTSFERVDANMVPARGIYVLSTQPLAMPQEGCGRETSVTYGSVVSGRLTADDCEATREAGDPVVRRSDGYDFLLRPGRRVKVTVTADFPYRFSFWANGQPVQNYDVKAGDTRILTAGGVGFLDFYVLSGQEGAFGNYTIRFEAEEDAS